MKIYCIKLDAMPFCPEVLAIQKLVNGHFARQISGSCSLETACQMLTGKHSSQLEEHGMGHTLWQERVADLSKSVGPVDTWPEEGTPKWDWIEGSLPLILHKEGYKCVAVNPFVLSGPLGYVRYPFYQHLVIPEGHLDEHHAYIQKIQTDQSDMLYMINYGIGHVAVDTSSSYEDMKDKLRESCEHILKILKYWNFSEPNTLFWIYSDHGPWRWPILGSYPDTCNFITWAVMKDNTDEPVAPLSKVISAQDFFHIVLSKFGLSPVIINTEKRIYITEDGRHHSDAKKSTTAMACIFEENVFTYLMYNELEDKFLQRTLEYSDETKDFSVHSESTTEINADLLAALKQHFGWMKK